MGWIIRIRVQVATVEVQVQCIRSVVGCRPVVAVRATVGTAGGIVRGMKSEQSTSEHRKTVCVAAGVELTRRPVLWVNPHQDSPCFPRKKHNPRQDREQALADGGGLPNLYVAPSRHRQSC